MNRLPLRIGFISAMQEEQTGLIDALQNRQTETRGMREYISGDLNGLPSVFVLSRMGKVAAAATAVTLIERFAVTHIVFTGVAGAASDAVKVGDIVVATELVQHDMDASPLFPRFEIPLTGLSHFAVDAGLSEKLVAAAQDFLRLDYIQTISGADRAQFHLHDPQVHRGLIASGDEFVSCANRLATISEGLPGLLAIEMEGAAVAQVCFEFAIPFAVMRTISDAANEDSPVDFARFIQQVAAQYALHVIGRLASSVSAL